MESKKPWLSKTLWANFVMAGLALFVPGAHEWAMGNPELVVLAFSLVNTALRMVSKDKLQLKD